MNRKYKIALVLLIVASILFTEGVSAEMISKQVCVSNILYDVKWDSTVSTEVTLDKIDEKAIETGNVIHHFITTETVDITKYEFKSVSTAQKCETAQNGDIITCPGDSGLGDIDIRHFLDTTESDEKIVTGITGTEKIYENKLVYKNIDMQINESTGLVYVKIKDIFNGAIKLRNVMNVKENKNEYANKKATDYPEGEFLTLSNGYYHVGYVSPEDIVSLEAYLTGNTKTGKCQNIYLGNVGFKMPVAGEFDITNPTIANPKAYNCNLVHENKNMPTNFKEMAFPECYKSKRPTITLAEKAGLADLIYKRYEKLADLFEKYSLKDPNDPISSTLNDADFSCTAGKQTGRLNNSYSSAGSYWALDCYEEYEIVPASPKLVSAGDGFHYGVDVVIRRYCDLTQTGMVQKKEVCKRTCGHECYLPDGTNPWGDPGRAGPNNDFDDCVLKCDNGEYSQSCINACYEEVYKDDSSRVDDVFSGNLIDDYNSGAKVDKLAAAVLPGKTITRYRTDNDDCPTINSCSDKCGNEYRYSDWCEGKGTICTEWETIGPSGCSFTPTSDYISDLAELESELNNYIAYMGGYVNLNDGDYTISIMDSYLKNSNGKQYTYVFSDSTDPKLHKSVEEIGEDISSVSNAQIGSEGETISYVSSAMRGKIVHVSLPNSYTSIVKGEAYYKTDSKNNLKLYSANLKTGGFNKTVYSKYLYYPEEGQEDNVYFTSLLSPNFNVTVNDKMVYLKNESESTRSIKVDIQNIGSAVRTDKYSNDGFDKSVDCYYGVYNFMLTCTDPPCEEKEICEIELCDDPPCKEICYEEKPEGIEFIFRPIDLNDNFPNDRNPRWNWTSDAAVTDDTSSVYKLLDYKIDPTKLISNIESKNYSIYNDPAEIDYDITLTPELLNNIKKYNKNVEKNIGDVNGDGYYNYLDYDMTCGNDSYRHYCYSNFLDNPNYVKFNSTNRKDIAICNNTYNGACANLGGKS